jgi:TP901 family phage tail tape measure protein
MSLIANIAIGLSANVAKFITNMSSASKVYDKFYYSTKKARASFNTGFSKMKSFGLYAGAGMGYAINSAAEFNKAMAEVSTIVDTGAVNMATLTDEVLALSRNTGKAPAELAHGLYQTISSGVSASEAMMHLGDSTRAAIAGVADVSDAVDLSTNVMNAYGKGVYGLGRIFDVAFKSVELGKTTFTELASEIGSMLPFASRLNVAIEDLFAATATLTKGGINTAEATTYLRTVMASIITPTEDALKAADKFGITLSSAEVRARGFLPFLQDVQEKTKGNTDAMAKFFPSISSLTAVLSLAGKQSQEFSDIQYALANSTGAMQTAFGKMASSDSAKYNKTLNELKITMIEIGRVGLPVLLDAVNAAKRFYSAHPLIVKLAAAMFLVNKLGIIPMISGISGMIGKLPILLSGLHAWAAAQTLITSSTIMMQMAWGAQLAGIVVVGIALYKITGYLSEIIGLTDLTSNAFKHWGEKLGIFEKVKSTAETKAGMRETWKKQMAAGQITTAEYDRRIASVATAGTSGQRSVNNKSPQIDQTNKTLAQIRDRLGPARAM